VLILRPINSWELVVQDDDRLEPPVIQGRMDIAEWPKIAGGEPREASNCIYNEETNSH